MAIIHFRQREIEARIVYWGPALSGKTTSLRALHDFTPRGRRGMLETLDTQDERTLFFDYLPLMWGTIAGFKGRVKVLGVPGQSMYRATRRLLLQGADGVVFVADSHPDLLSANVESLNELQRALASLGRSLDEMPLVFQYNKRDLADALPEKVLQMALNAREAPAIPTVAIASEGIAESFQAVLELVSQRVEHEISGGSDRDLVRGAVAPPLPDKEEVRQTLHAIAQLRPGEEAAVQEPSAAGAAEGIPAVDGVVADRQDPATSGGEPSALNDPTEEAPLPEEPELESDTDIPDDLTERAPEAEASAEPAPSPAPGVASDQAEQPAYAIVNLPYRPPQLEDYDLYDVAEPIVEPDDTVMVRISLAHPQTGRVRRVRVRLVPDAAAVPASSPAPPPAPPQRTHVGQTLFTLIIGFGLGVGVVWLFLS